MKKKTYSHLKQNNDEDKKAKCTKRCVIKRKVKFQDYKNSLNPAKTDEKIKYYENKKNNGEKLKEVVKNKLILKTQQKIKMKRHIVFTEVINKIALSSNDVKECSQSIREKHVHMKRARI